MLFCSYEFLVFFAVIFTAYWLLARPRVRLLLGLAGGAYFLWVAWKCIGVVAGMDWSAAGDPGSFSDPFPVLRAKLEFATAAMAIKTAIIPALRGLEPAKAGYGWMAGIVCAGAWIAAWRGQDRGRVWMLLIASFYFYSCWNAWLALLICLTTAMDYAVARGMDALSHRRLRLGLLLFSLVINLGLLVYFKYANFFIDSLKTSLQSAGVTVSLPVLQVILPIGISFYTFEAINYTVDVYRRQVRAERNLANFMLFITFFPHLVAGPIVRARDFLPQIHRRKRFDWARIELGVRFFILGLLKKWALADRMAQFADPVFATPSAYGTYATWLAVIAYALQIYGDFSGYSDMALGTAHMLGYKLARNFNMPYLAANVSEFWRRWHISLSTWLRDYLFIPLGGSRGSKWQTARNLMITMTLGGLWHGASWTFVVWGVLHGLLLVIHRPFRDFCEARPRLDRALRSLPGTALRVACTFLAVSLCWVFFRAQTFLAAKTILRNLFRPVMALDPPLAARWLLYTVLVVALFHLIGASGLWKRWAGRIPAPVLGCGYALLLTLALLLAPDSGKAFIYFQF
jgi:alginate O-acetyltransferase complex protein AlgI